MNDFARRMTQLGIRFPLRGEMANGRVLVDADGHAVAMVLPNQSSTLERDRAEALIDTLNALAGFGAERDAA